MKHVESNNQKGKVSCFFLTEIQIRILEEFRGYLLLFELKFQFKIHGEFRGHLLHIRLEFSVGILDEFHSHLLSQFFSHWSHLLFSDRYSEDILPTGKFFYFMFKNADDHGILSKFVSNQIFGQKSSWLRLNCLKIYDLHLSLKCFSYISGGFQY